MKKNLFLILLYSFSIEAVYDLTVVGVVKYADGLGRLPIVCIDILKDKMKINYIPTRDVDYSNLSNPVKSVIQNPDKSPGKVSILFDALAYKGFDYYKFVPESQIKFAYSMLESSAIPQMWVDILNNKFDAVLVPDEFYIDAYSNSGVKIPIFLFPHGVYLDEFLNREPKAKQNSIFTFGCSAVFEGRKNQKLLINAFAREFGNNKNVCLKLHGRWGEDYEELQKLVKDLKLNNVEFINKKLENNEYIDFLASLDCLVLLSKGEGFSVVPREVLAMGVPCILSNNTAHKTICKTNLVKRVKSNIPVKAYYPLFNDFCGVNFDCEIEDVQKALLDVYKNYSFYLQKAGEGRNWAKQYNCSELSNRYYTLVKPNQVMLGSENKILDGIIITNSKQLYEKYLKI